ncbi:Embryonic polarity protein dorsal [Amphibalanus amphitrite]|uniref:Embryonic polarity protein dorsal n=1 Tax=Amphibalanus amphitrite TaxID=1232801 RepID=A0A6A4X6E2_AMPAM|nr:Embryonic polarity protein dorsal [Amphibalanus amphitrite]
MNELLIECLTIAAYPGATMESAPPDGPRNGNLNISDVLDVIQTDLDYADTNMAGYAPAGPVPRPDEFDPLIRARRQAEVEITEQPASKALRFRYECEGRSAGSIPGANSTADNKTFPSVRVVGYQGPAVVVVSCVTKDPPYRPHPHNLVGKDGCKKGVCTVNLNVETMSVTFQNLGIQCVKKKDVEESLRLRESIRVDPFQTGFDHRLQPTTIDLNAVRLCFQVFVEGHKRDQYVVPLKPVISDAIYDKKSMCDLVIYKMSDCSASVAGGKDIILLCDKVTKDDIEVRFFEVRDNRLYWEAFGEFLPADVHKQVAICFKTPRYASLELESPVRAQIQLRRPSDKQCSEARPFTFTPLDSGRPFWSYKRAKTHVSLFHRLLSWETGDEPSAKRGASADGRRSAELTSAVLGDLPAPAPAAPAAAPAEVQPPLPPKRLHRVKRDTDCADYALPMPGQSRVEAPTKAEILLRRYTAPSPGGETSPGRGLLAADFNNGNYERVEQMALYAGVAPMASASEFDEANGIEEKKRKMARNSGRLQQYLADNLGSDQGPSVGRPFGDLGARPKVKAAAKRMKQIKPEPVDAPAASDPVFVPSSAGRGPTAAGGAAIVSPSGMSGGGIVQQTQYIRPGGAAGAEPIKAEYLYPVPGGPQYQGYRSPQHPAATPPPPPGAVSPGPPPPPPPAGQHQLFDMDAQRPVTSAANIELDLSQLNSADLNLLSFPSDLDANQQAIEGHLSSNLSQSLSFLEEGDAPPPPPPPPAAVAVAPRPEPAGQDEPQDVQMDSFTRNTISELEFLNQLSKR